MKRGGLSLLLFATLCGCGQNQATPNAGTASSVAHTTPKPAKVVDRAKEAGCAPQLEADGAEAEYAGSGGTVSLQARITNEGAEPCELNSTLHLALEDASGTSLSVPGNPIVVAIKRRLESKDHLTVESIWAQTQYCEDEQDFRVEADFGDLHASGDSPAPLCGPLDTAAGYTDGPGLSEPEVENGLLP